MSVPFHNPYWDEVKNKLETNYRGNLEVGLFSGTWTNRFDFTGRYSWTITDPGTVAFVSNHLGAAVDPLAGSGYWAYLMRQLGHNILAYDKNPPREDTEANQWHKNVKPWVHMERQDAIETMNQTDPERTLLLSWPPYDDPIGTQILKSYQGNRVVYIGELEGMCCGDDELFRLFESDWTLVDEYEPIQWSGMHDWVQVFDRRVRAISQS